MSYLTLCRICGGSYDARYSCECVYAGERKRRLAELSKPLPSQPYAELDAHMAKVKQMNASGLYHGEKWGPTDEKAQQDIAELEAWYARHIN